MERPIWNLILSKPCKEGRRTMTKDVFNQERFRAYVAKLWAEQKRFAMTFCLILAGLIFAAELFAVFTCYHVPSYAVDNNMPAEDPIRNGIVVECLLLLFAGGCIAASRMLADGQQKAGRIHVLTQPVSMFENWLARVLIFVVGYFVAFHAIYYGFELVRVAIFSPVFPQSHISVQHLFSFAGSSDMLDRKSTRLNSSHANISYAVFCLK